MDECLAVMVFNNLKGWNKKKLLTIFDFYGSSKAALSHIKHDEKLQDHARRELELAEKNAITIIPITSPLYPSSIKVLADAPLILYVKGQLPHESVKKIALIGTRACTEWGKECTYHFSQYLSAHGLCIVSGLARGIDTAAHSGALTNTVAIIGSGLLALYPKENEELAAKICRHGALISECNLSDPPTRFSFPRRNRLLAAYSDALLLTEAPYKSGAMITMQLGLKQNKKLFCLPGRAMNENYAGNHALIKEGKAELVQSPQELAKLLQITIKEQQLPLSPKTTILAEEQKILDLLIQSDLSIDELSIFTCLPSSHLQVILTKLVLKNVIMELPGKRYKGKIHAWQSH